MPELYCAWCNRKILTKPDYPGAGESDLCLDCLLTFLSGDRPERRQGERRRYTANPPEERRNDSDRRG